jgi:hypothetical protein
MYQSSLRQHHTNHTVTQDKPMSFYELALMGMPTDEQVDELEQNISQIIAPFGLRLRDGVGWSVRSTDFDPPPGTAAAVAFFGGTGVSETGLAKVLRKAIPVVPIASASGRISAEIPTPLQRLNCLVYHADGPQRIATALLECASLLPRQRRVFLSYRRCEARAAALQLFDAFSARLFDVFLDTHDVAPGEDFQEALWHHLCDSDVLVMLDTATYFKKRWTAAEYGRALAKGISVLRVGWPDVNRSSRTATASHLDLAADEINASGYLTNAALQRICMQLEILRSQSHAVRNLNLFSHIQQAVELIGGKVVGTGMRRAIYITLSDSSKVVIYPTVGVPTAFTLYEAATFAPDERSVAVVYDHVGLRRQWLEHLDWLGQYIRVARWVKASEVSWSFADWER